MQDRGCWLAQGQLVSRQKSMGAVWERDSPVHTKDACITHADCSPQYALAKCQYTNSLPVYHYVLVFTFCSHTIQLHSSVHIVFTTPGELVKNLLLV